MKRFSLLIFIILIGCLGYIHHDPYVYTLKPYHQSTLKTIPIYIDKDFGDQDLIYLDDAIRQWNYSLNGYIKLEIVSTKFDMEQDIIKKALSGNAWLILKIYSNNEMVYDSPGSLTVAFVNKIGGNVLFLVRDRLSYEEITGVSLHEIGHLLGAKHNSGLMSAEYNKNGLPCVDQIAMVEVAEYQGLPAKDLNYCQFGEVQ